MCTTGEICHPNLGDRLWPRSGASTPMLATPFRLAICTTSTVAYAHPWGKMTGPFAVNPATATMATWFLVRPSAVLGTVPKLLDRFQKLRWPGPEALEQWHEEFESETLIYHQGPGQVMLVPPGYAFCTLSRHPHNRITAIFLDKKALHLNAMAHALVRKEPRLRPDFQVQWTPRLICACEDACMPFCINDCIKNIYTNFQSMALTN